MFFQYMKKHKIDVNLHYIPVHLHPFYKNNFGTKEGICPVAEKLSNSNYISFQMCLYELDEHDINKVGKAFRKVWKLLLGNK